MDPACHSIQVGTVRASVQYRTVVPVGTLCTHAPPRVRPRESLSRECSDRADRRTAMYSILTENAIQQITRDNSSGSEMVLYCILSWFRDGC